MMRRSFMLILSQIQLIMFAPGPVLQVLSGADRIPLNSVLWCLQVQQGIWNWLVHVYFWPVVRLPECSPDWIQWPAHLCCQCRLQEQKVVCELEEISKIITNISSLGLQIRAAEVVWLSTPNTAPHCSDWKAPKPRGTGIFEMPSMLRSGMKMNPLVHKVGVGEEWPAAATVVAGVVPRIPKGSGEVVEDCFHWIAQ